MVGAMVLLGLWSGRRWGPTTQARPRRRGPQVPGPPRRV